MVSKKCVWPKRQRAGALQDAVATAKRLQTLRSVLGCGDPPPLSIYETHTSEVRAEQVTNTQPEAIYLGVDLHKQSITVARIIDHSTAQPAQTMSWDKFWCFAQKQLTQAKKVYVVYEAGAFGFWPAG